MPWNLIKSKPILTDDLCAFFKTQCQMMEQAEEGNEEEDDSEDPDSEASEKLIEYAGDVLPALGCAMTPSEFAPYFAGLLPSILQRTVSIQILYST